MSDPILPGAEPESWPGGPDAALVLHGFTGTPQSMRPLARALAGTGLSVELPLLPGHGTSVADMLATDWADWSGAAESAYADLAARCRRVLLVGLSMGGTLACWLASRHPEVVGLVVINPFVEAPAESFYDIVRGVLEAGFELAPGIGADIADPRQSEVSYHGMPIRPALSLFEATGTLDLARIACPVLLLQSRQDHVVPPSSGEVLVRACGAEQVWLERSYHVATLDYDRAEVEERTVAFAKKLLGGRAHPRRPAT